MYISSIRTYDKLIVMVTIFLSGNMVFMYGDRKHIFYTIVAIWLTFLMYRKSLKIDNRTLGVTFGFATIFTAQSIYFSFLPLITIAGFMIKLYIAYSVVRVVPRMFSVYVEVMYYISIVALLFYIPDQLLSLLDVDFRVLFKPINDLVGIGSGDNSSRMNILLYNFQVGMHSHRNSALFWEPGAYAGYLLLALIFLSLYRSSFSSSKFNIMFLTFVIALLTTQSTMGFIVLPFVLFLYMSIIKDKAASPYDSLFIMGALVISISVFMVIAVQLEFIGGKLTHLFNLAVSKEAGWQLSRFGAMVFDWEYIKAHPLIGWGQNDATQYQLHADIDQFALGNGMTGFVRQFGFAGMALFLVSAWIGVNTIVQNKKRTSYIIGVILLMLNGEYFLMYPVFLALMFIRKTTARMAMSHSQHGSPKYQKVDRLILSGCKQR